MPITAIFIILILIPISLIHFYWAMGGQWGSKASIPTSVDGAPLFNPRKTDCVVVGVCLLFLSGVVLDRAELLNPSLLGERATFWILAIFASIFTLRAIGEFNHVGFFSKPRTSLFRKYDRQLFSPLCLLLGILLTRSIMGG